MTTSRGQMSGSLEAVKHWTFFLELMKSQHAEDEEREICQGQPSHFWYMIYDTMHAYIYICMIICVSSLQISLDLFNHSVQVYSFYRTIPSLKILGLKRRHHLGFGRFQPWANAVASCRCGLQRRQPLKYVHFSSWTCCYFTVNDLAIFAPGTSSGWFLGGWWFVGGLVVVQGNFLYSTRELDKILWILPTDLKIRCPFVNTQYYHC